MMSAQCILIRESVEAITLSDLQNSCKICTNFKSYNTLFLCRWKSGLLNYQLREARLLYGNSVFHRSTTVIMKMNQQDPRLSTDKWIVLQSPKLVA